MLDLQRTLELIDEGALDDAAAALEDIIAQMPAYTPAYVLLAQTYEAQARWPEALKAWQRARFFAPNSPTVQAGLMRALDHQALDSQDAASEDAPSEDAVEHEAPDATPPDAMDEVASELLETLRDDEDEPSADVEWPEESTLGDADHSPAPDAPPPSEASTPTPPPSFPQAEETLPDTEIEPEDAPEGSEDVSAEDKPETQPKEERDSSSDLSGDGGDFPPSAEPRSSPLDELMRQLPDTDQPLPEDLQDLDRLIDELESARIDPQPDVSDPPEPNLESDIDDMVSETLARIYISQKQYKEAARVYLRLASQEPDRAKEYMEKAAELNDRARDPDTEN